MISRRRFAGGTTCALLAATAIAGAQSAASAAGSPGAPYGGFTTSATATPLRLEVYEPAIPVPASPQGELNFSWTNVTGGSGPDSTAKVSALWPGAAVGDGLPVILGTTGLPPQLASNNYPIVAAAQYPGSPSSASQEPLPGMVGTVSGSATQAVSRAGYSPTGQVAGDPSAPASSSPLSQLQSGNLTGLLAPSTGPSSGTNPLGVLSAVISPSGMSASSVTDYGDPVTVDAVATSQVGELDLVGGIVKLTNVNVSATSASSLGGGGKSTPAVTYGGMTINGTPFNLTSDGIQAASTNTAIPGMPSDPNQALATLGISITLPKPVQTIDGKQATTTASGPVITMDTQPLITMLQLNKLPLSSIVNQFPDSAAQLKATLLGVFQAHPKFVILLGSVTASAETIEPVDLSSGTTTTPTETSDQAPTGGDVGGATEAPAPGGLPPAFASHLKKTSMAPGLPPLGSIPGLLMLGGLILALGAAWLLRTLAAGALGAAGTCIHGLTTGLPDLRKA